MTKPKALILDCDDVLLEYCDAVVEYIRTEYSLPIKQKPSAYDLEETFGVSKKAISTFLKNFNSNSHKFGLLSVKDPHCITSLKFIKTIHPDIKFIIVSKCGTNITTQLMRKINLNHVFGDIFDEMIFLEGHKSKKQCFSVLQEKYDVRCVVDDHISNINCAIELGISGIVYKQEHNKNECNIKYNIHQDWFSIGNYICANLLK